MHPQKGHGKKRPRRFHRGRAEGRRAIATIDQLAAAERRGAELEASACRASQRLLADVGVWADFAHAAPFVPAFQVRL